RIRQRNLLHAEPVEAAVEHVEVRATRGEHPAAAVANALVERDARTRHRQIRGAAHFARAARAARAQVDGARRATERDRTHAGMEEHGTEDLGREAGKDADGVHGIEEWDAVERDTRLRPRRTACPELGSVVVARGDAG